jgi:hypothetical protein
MQYNILDEETADEWMTKVEEAIANLSGEFVCCSMDFNSMR